MTEIPHKKGQMYAVTQAFELIKQIAQVEISDDDYNEFCEHISKADATHGLLWGQIAVFGKETEALEMLKFMRQFLGQIRRWRKDENFLMAYLNSVNQETLEDV